MFVKCLPAKNHKNYTTSTTPPPHTPHSAQQFKQTLKMQKSPSQKT
jgi:hypothetical protein